MRTTVPAGLVSFLSALIAGGACASGAVEPPYPDVPDYEGLSTANLPAAMQLVVPLRRGCSGFCPIQSLSMQIAFIDPSSTTEEVFALSGYGATLSYSSSRRSFNPSAPDEAVSFHQRTLLESYGAHFVIGSGAMHGYGDFLDAAEGKLRYGNGVDALAWLKAVIRSGRPVQVHLDAGYLATACWRLNPTQCGNLTPGASHFMAVTGYDPDSVYVNETPPIDPGQPTGPADRVYQNIGIPVGEFLTAWEAAGDIGNGPNRYGPWWMLFIEERSAARLNRKPVAQVLAMQRELSRNVGADIDQNAMADMSLTDWRRIATAKRMFGAYLERSGFADAGALYNELADLYDGCCGMKSSQAQAMMSGTIRQLEVEARSRF